MPRGGRRRTAAKLAATSVPQRIASLRLASGAPAGVVVALPSEADILSAVESLYNDELRPYSRILKKRLAEQHSIPAGAMKDSDSDGLRALCESSTSLRVETENGGEWSVLLTNRGPNFVDIYDNIDVYPEHFWVAAEFYFRRLSKSGDYRFPGGRYASARALAARQLPFLANFSLGQVCHFMQIAVSKRKLLGYADGAMVPYTCSTSLAKSVCAQQKRPLSGSAAAELGSEVAPLAVADWEAARGKMKEILDSAALRGSSFVPLSNVKRLFRSLHQLELSETALGHCKLTDLLQDARFHDICAVRLRDRGYIVVPAAPMMEAPTHPILNSPPREEKWAVDVATGLPTDGRGVAPPVRHTFIHFRQLPPTPCAQAAVCRSCSVPPSSTNCSASCSSGINSSSINSSSCSRDSSLETDSHSRRPPAAEQKEALFCPDEPLCLEEAKSQDAVWPQFCPDEPLSLEDAIDVNTGSSLMEDWASPAPCPAWTPSPHYSCNRSLLAPSGGSGPRVLRLACVV